MPILITGRIPLTFVYTQENYCDVSSSWFFSSESLIIIWVFKSLIVIWVFKSLIFIWVFRISDNNLRIYMTSDFIRISDDRQSFRISDDHLSFRFWDIAAWEFPLHARGKRLTCCNFWNTRFFIYKKVVHKKVVLLLNWIIKIFNTNLRKSVVYYPIILWSLSVYW